MLIIKLNFSDKFLFDFYLQSNPKNTMARGQMKKQKDEPKGVMVQLSEFQRDSVNFFQKCKKPDRAEYMRIMQACAMGFVVMGFIGYLIKLVFIPINNIILS